MQIYLVAEHQRNYIVFKTTTTWQGGKHWLKYLQEAANQQRHLSHSLCYSDNNDFGALHLHFLKLMRFRRTRHQTWYILQISFTICGSQWSRGLRRVSETAQLLGLPVRIPQGTWMSIFCKCCVLSGRSLCASGWSLVQRSPTDSGVSECDREASIMRRF